MKTRLLGFARSRSGARESPLSRKQKRRIIYLGWLGFANYGDDLLLYVWQKVLNNRLEVRAPLQNSDYLRHVCRYFIGLARLIGTERIILLGGGTTLGFENWAAHLRRAQRYYRTRRVVVVGAGAAESNDEYAFGIQSAGWKQWSAIDGLGVWGVRGPLTQVELRERIAVESPVTGDPALMYPFLIDSDSVDTAARGATSGAASHSELGVCVGSHHSTRFDLEKIAAAIQAAIPTAAFTTVRLFQLSVSDRDVTTQLAGMLGDLVSGIHVYEGNIENTTAAIRQCSTFVSERLHGAIVAVSFGVPTVTLAYASKCDDFWLSVSGQRPSVTPSSTVEQIRRAIVGAASTAERLDLFENAAILGRQSMEVAEHLRAWVEGSDSEGLPVLGA